MPAQPVRRAFGFVGGFLALFFVLAFVMAFLRAGKGSTGFLPGTSVVAVVPLEGEIERSDDFVETLADLQEDQRYAAVVVRIDSPGGAVAPSQEMYEAVRRLREKKPVIASLGSVAASGGASRSMAAIRRPGGSLRLSLMAAASFRLPGWTGLLFFDMVRIHSARQVGGWQAGAPGKLPPC